LASVPVGATGSPLMQNLNQELNKLVIGQRWKDATGNTIADDEPIRLIRPMKVKLLNLLLLKCMQTLLQRQLGMQKFNVILLNNKSI
jgi:hypothetical protein